MAREAGDQPEAGGATHLRRSAELLWGTRERSTRGPKPGLTLERIVAAAIAVADADGLDGLSMRRVAAELGVGAMSLYRYVPGKAELLDLMLDQVSGPSEAVCGAAVQGWRAAIEVIAWEGRALYLAHPWLLQVNWSRPVFGPNTLAGFEQSIATLDGLGLTGQEKVSIMITVDSFVTGNVRQQVRYASAPEETGISNEDFWSQQYPVLEAAMSTGDYPSVAALDEDAFAAGWEETFEFGLHRLLDGVALLIESRRPDGAGGD